MLRITEKNSQANVPFSWEHKPGVCKVTATHQETANLLHNRLQTLSLPPPPCPSSSSSKSSIGFDESRVRFSPGPTSKGTLKKVSCYNYDQFKDEEAEADPFLAAYKKCTGQYSVSSRNGGIGEGRRRMRRHGGVGGGATRSFSCKHSCVVANANLVKMSQISRPLIKGKEKD